MGALGNLIPLVILFIVVGGGGYIGYQIYCWSNEMGAKGKQSMEKRNMSWTKDGGLKVGVKEVNTEKEADRTQKVLVNAWNSSGYGDSGKSNSRPSTGRTNSGQRPGTQRMASGASGKKAL